MGSNKAINISKIKADLDLSVSKSTVLRAIKEDNNLVYKKMRQSPNLKEAHKLKRDDFALDKILWTRQWHKVIFSDEKKFNLDGPDGFKYYWHHVNKEEISYSKRIQDGGGIMVWASFCSSEQLILQIVSNKMNSTSY